MAERDGSLPPRFPAPTRRRLPTQFPSCPAAALLLPLCLGGSLHTWYPATCLLTESKNGISATYLKRRLSVRYHTAWSVKQELMRAMQERDESQPLRGSTGLSVRIVGIREARLVRALARAGPLPAERRFPLPPPSRPLRRIAPRT